MGFDGALQIVTNPYGSKESAMRKGLVINGEWKKPYADFIIENDIAALYLNSALGFVGDDFKFLTEVPGLQELNIIVGEAKNLEAIGSLVKLEELSITCSTKSMVDASNLTNLKKLFLYWWVGAKSFLSNRNITSIYLDKFDAKYAGEIAGMPLLENLTIGNSAISDVCFIDKCELQKLELLNCKKLQDYSSISKQARLRWLSIRGCGDVHDLCFLPSPSQIEVLLLSDAGEIASLGPIQSQQQLQAFAFDGSTKVRDLDLSPLLSLPKLSMLMFKPRKGYTHKLIKNWSWNNFGCPDTLLAEIR